MTKITQVHLTQLGRVAAEAWDECDQALDQLNQGFGVVYESARDNLTKDINEASKEGLDLSVFSGKSSLFKYEELRTNIVVKVSKLPTPHEKLLKLDERIAEIERTLKAAKAERKYLIERFSIKGDIELVTDKVNLAFTRIK